ncbi:hypothetical protein C8J57DRAFT_1231441 [Mycena rebaudengoi]|nr:hypothetical protein C8J57DRAFT_1231441 [Mycena rebaudengoi]
MTVSQSKVDSDEAILEAEGKYEESGGRQETATLTVVEANPTDAEVGAGADVEHTWGAEETWRHDELERIARRREKERARKAAQLQRRAEQPLPFPGLGHSPAAWTEPIPHQPRPFPVPKPKPQPPAHYTEELVERSRNRSTSPGGGCSGRTTMLSEEDGQLEEEYERICFMQAHAPWAESRFARYLHVDPLPDMDEADASDNTGDWMVEQGKRIPTAGTQRRRRGGAKEDWEKLLAEARQADKRNTPARRAQPVPAAEARQRQDSRDAMEFEGRGWPDTGLLKVRTAGERATVQAGRIEDDGRGSGERDKGWRWCGD